MNKFLRDGIKDKNVGQPHESGSSESHEPKPTKERSNLELEDINLSSLQQGNDLKVNMQSSGDAVDGQISVKKKLAASIADSTGSDKPSNPKKAKLIRLERKKEKLAAKGLTLDDVDVKKTGNVEKSLEDFLSEEPKDGKHRLEVSFAFQFRELSNFIIISISQVKLVQSKEGTDKEIFNLYQKYQVQVHQDPPEKLSIRSYERFLVNSPLQVKITTTFF